MPLHFKINDTEIPITDVAMAKLHILEVENPNVKPYPDDEKQEFPLDRIACIDEGDCLFLSAEEKRYKLLATLGTTTCLQVFLFNNKDESCLLHLNYFFTIPWKRIMEAFSDHHLSMIVIGASQLFPRQASNNIQSFFSDVIDYTSKHPSVEITLTHQLVLEHNPHQTEAYARFFPHKQYILQNTGFTPQGEVYDLDVIRKNIPEFPLAIDLRKARLCEAQHRGSIRYNYKDKPFPIPELLFMTPHSTLSELKSQTYFHKFFIDFVTYIHRTKKLKAYCDHVNTFAGIKAGTPEEKSLIDETTTAFQYVETLYQSSEMKELVNYIQKYPSSPYNPTLLSHKTNYLPFAEEYYDHVEEDAGGIKNKK